MAPPTLVSRNDPFCRENLVKVTFNGAVIGKGLVSADSTAGVLRQEVSQEEARTLSNIVSLEPLVGRDRFLAIRKGTVTITVVLPGNDENFTPGSDEAMSPWPERGRPPVKPSETEKTPKPTPWASY